MPVLKYDFTGFIITNQQNIFGKSVMPRTVDFARKYRRNIAALDIKMNELIAGDSALSHDPKFLLGLFALSISQFGVTVRTDLTQYEREFYQLIENSN